MLPPANVIPATMSIDGIEAGSDRPRRRRPSPGLAVVPYRIGKCLTELLPRAQRSMLSYSNRRGRRKIDTELAYCARSDAYRPELGFQRLLELAGLG